MHFGLWPRSSITWSKAASLPPHPGSASLPSPHLCLGKKKPKKPLSKACNLDLRSTAGRDYIYNSLFTEEWGVIFGLISAFWTQSLFLPQRCKAVKNQSSCSVLPQSWQPPWATNFLRKGFEGITWNAFVVLLKAEQHPLDSTQPSSSPSIPFPTFPWLSWAVQSESWKFSPWLSGKSMGWGDLVSKH